MRCNWCTGSRRFVVIFGLRSGKLPAAKSREQSGAWYADPYGTAARRWYDDRTGWSDQVQDAGQTPDKTGLERMDEAAVAPNNSPRLLDGDGKLLPLSRPVDPKYMTNARPVR
jgi:hypothetical protein